MNDSNGQPALPHSKRYKRMLITGAVHRQRMGGCQNTGRRPVQTNASSAPRPNSPPRPVSGSCQAPITATKPTVMTAKWANKRRSA